MSDTPIYDGMVKVQQTARAAGEQAMLARVIKLLEAEPKPTRQLQDVLAKVRKLKAGGR